MDTMPVHQITDLECALINKGVPSTLYTTFVIPNNHHHAFGYWEDWNGVSQHPPLTIAYDVETFFCQKLGGTCPPLP